MSISPQLLHKLGKLPVEFKLLQALFLTQSSSAMPTRSVFPAPAVAWPRRWWLQPEWLRLQEPVRSRERLGWVAGRDTAVTETSPGPFWKWVYLKGCNYSSAWLILAVTDSETGSCQSHHLSPEENVSDLQAGLPSPSRLIQSITE